MKDGVGERLISINPSALNVPAFKNAGWGSPSEIRRTYSPPIPVGAETEYFTNNPPKSIRDSPVPPPIGGIALGGDDGLLASHFSNESVELAMGKAPKTESAKGARRARELHREEDDSSDMSEDSDDDDGSQAFVPIPVFGLWGWVFGLAAGGSVWAGSGRNGRPDPHTMLYGFGPETHSHTVLCGVLRSETQSHTMLYGLGLGKGK